MIPIASIVEGDSEVSSLPILLRRLSEWPTTSAAARPLPPIRVRRDRFLHRDDEFRRQLLLASSKCGHEGWILVLLDADDDCPAELGEDILKRARAHVGHRRLSVVLANREYEAWFIAAAASLDGTRGFAAPDRAVEAERPRDAKGWLRERMQGGAYRVLLDQPAFTATMDLQLAHDNSRSFRKLCAEWQRHVQGRD